MAIKEGNVTIPEKLFILKTADGKITPPIIKEQAEALQKERPDAKIKYEYTIKELK